MLVLATLARDESALRRTAEPRAGVRDGDAFSPAPERAEPAAPAPAEEHPVAEGPAPDLDEPGRCSVTLRLVESATGRPKKGRVRLWRLGLPETEDWTAGDRVRAELDVPVEGVTLDGLPAGRYRVDVDGQPLAAEAPPAFELRDGHVFEDIAVPSPRSFRVTLRVLDEHGRPVTGRASLSYHGRKRSPRPPEWANLRRNKHRTTFMGGACGMAGTRLRLRAEQAWTVPEPTRGGSGSYYRRVGPQGRSAVRLEIGALDGERSYVAPSVPLAVLRSRIGAPPGAEIRAVAYASADTDWRDVPIGIRWGERRFAYTVRSGVAAPAAE